MTISSLVCRNQYVCSAGLTEYDYTFRIHAPSDLKVIMTEPSGAETMLVIDAGYVVMGAGQAEGGRVVLEKPPIGGEVLTILRNAPFTQEMDLVDNDPFGAEVIEGAFDKLTMLVQQVLEMAGRSLRLPESTALSDTTLPNPSAGLAIGWNAGGDGLTNLANLGGVGVSPFMQTVLDDSDGEGVLASLGFSVFGRSLRAAVDAAAMRSMIGTAEPDAGLTLLPSGFITPFMLEDPPSGWLECDGSAISRETYSNLFDGHPLSIGVRFGPGDGSTTFNLPDFRGMFVRGWDHGAGRDQDSAGRADRGDGVSGDRAGTVQEDSLQGHWHEAYTRPGSGTGYVALEHVSNVGAISTSPTQSQIKEAKSDGEHGAPRVSGETRPMNIAMMWCIKWAPAGAAA